jgi:tetratricopeptide (TPR) repeat protein
MTATSDARMAGHEQAGAAPWWVLLGYPAFEAGPDGLPRPGQVSRYYRRLKRRPDGKRWTQADLARALGVTERYVNLMEHHDEGFDSFSRRRFLVEILAIPPVLLGLAEVSKPEHAGAAPQQAPAVISRPAFDVEQAAHRLQTLNLQGDRSTAGPALPTIQQTLGALYEALPFARSDRPQLQRLLVGYHTLAGSVLRDEQQPQQALDHLNRAVNWAESLQHPTWVAFALYRRMTALIECGQAGQALQDEQQVRRLLPRLPADLRVALLLRGGLAQAQAAVPSQSGLVLAHLDEAAAWLSEALTNPGDESYHLPLTRERFQIDRAAVLLALNWPREALESLPTRQMNGMTRANVYADLLAAEAYVRLGEYEQAATLGLEALPRARAIRSQVNLARVQRLYERLATSPFGSAPEVARLRLLLTHPRSR